MWLTLAIMTGCMMIIFAIYEDDSQWLYDPFYNYSFASCGPHICICPPFLTCCLPIVAQVYGPENLDTVFVQTLKIVPVGCIDDKLLIAPDDAFHDLRTRAKSCLEKNELYIAPHAAHVLSKLDRRIFGVTPPSPATQNTMARCQTTKTHTTPVLAGAPSPASGCPSVVGPISVVGPTSVAGPTPVRPSEADKVAKVDNAESGRNVPAAQRRAGSIKSFMTESPCPPSLVEASSAKAGSAKAGSAIVSTVQTDFSPVAACFREEPSSPAVPARKQRRKAGKKDRIGSTTLQQSTAILQQSTATLQQSTTTVQESPAAAVRKSSPLGLTQMVAECTPNIFADEELFPKEELFSKEELFPKELVKTSKKTSPSDVTAPQVPADHCGDGGASQRQPTSFLQTSGGTENVRVHQTADGGLSNQSTDQLTYPPLDQRPPTPLDQRPPTPLDQRLFGRFLWGQADREDDTTNAEVSSRSVVGPDAGLLLSGDAVS
ncbi:hypothetical protein GNI_010750 [Gregarina niphandrodes]|uniref:Transmembrane protein n=1 Tax=Gregarina niphandrodes TaxID=110365 RepID=A0A023BCW6_GRENI|nr:hypothetical protein GNI_010750 [Gregarina niphandrodes]EZG86213.1 hypothetical protein GNI_010750 [Gregarina niphandrodes]|eukprot:XP_011128781.1 hypothetical protein GNI_010750 [Gregarina niphandrodes]